MNLFNTPVVPASEDAWWAPLPASLVALAPCRVLVLVAATPQAAAFSDRIAKMLGACRLGPADYSIQYLPPGEACAWHRLRDEARPELVVLLGIDPRQLGILAQLPANVLTGFDGRHWIVSAAAEAFFADDSLRGHVWNQCLRPFFQL